jgi:hypothetical protein
MTLYLPGGPRRRTAAWRALRSRFLYWCLFFVPAALTLLAWNYGYPGAAGMTGLMAAVGLAWFVRVWRQTERR